MVNHDSDSIMVNQTSRFEDAHEQQIKQLQSDVTTIKDSLKVLHDDRSDSREFQKFVLNWMHHQDSRSNSISTSHLPASSSDSSLQCVIAKLEEIVSRSEERWYGKEHQFQAGRLDDSGPSISDSATLIYVDGTSPITSTEFDSKVNEKIIGTNHDDSGASDSHSSDIDEHLDEVINSKFELRDILKGSGSPPDYGVDMPNLGWVPTTTLISGSIGFATSVGNPQFGVFAPSPIPNNHPSQDRIGSKLLDVHTFEWKPGWDLGWLDYTRPAFASKLFVLDEDPKPPDPYTHLKSDLLLNLFHGWCKTASQVVAGLVGSYHLWLVHGQGRPPENALREAPAWLSS